MTHFDDMFLQFKEHRLVFKLQIEKIFKSINFMNQRYVICNIPKKFYVLFTQNNES